MHQEHIERHVVGASNGTEPRTQAPFRDRFIAVVRDGLVTLALTLALVSFAVSLLLHPRMDGNAAHRWLRGCVREVCAA